MTVSPPFVAHLHNEKHKYRDKKLLSLTDNTRMVFLDDEAFLRTESLKRPFNELNYKEKMTCYITDCPELGW